MRENVIALVSDSGALLNITGIEASPNRYSELRLEFAAGRLRLTCNGDTDEVIVEAGPVGDDGSPSVDSLSDLVGLTIADAWSMTNDRNYIDAFQIRFSDGEGREETRQFEVAASAMDVRRVTE
jgi:hypothetical protein